LATVSALLAAPVTITISPASLASSATFVAGRESSQIDNTSDLNVDALVSGSIMVGTTPTINTQIRIYVWGSHTSLATTAIDVLDGSDSAETISNTGILNSALYLAAVIDVSATTSDLAYPFKPFSVAQFFGNKLPRFWGLFLAHNTGVNLNATGGNHVVSYSPVKYTVA
jgi:hypothetical protein